MASKPKYKNNNKTPLTPEEYRKIQMEIDDLQAFRSRVGVVKSQRSRIMKGKKVKIKTDIKPRIFDIERFARE